MGAWDTLAREREEAVAIGAKAIHEREWLRTQNGELHRQIDYIRALVWDEISDEQIVGNLRRMLDRPMVRTSK